jgi:hypothetical protein
MARCHHCGSTFFFGAVREGEHRYCSDDCRGQNAFKVRCDQIPESTVLYRCERPSKAIARSATAEGPDLERLVRTHLAREQVAAEHLRGGNP